MFRDSRSAGSSAIRRRMLAGEEILLSPLVLSEVLRGFGDERHARRAKESLLEFPVLELSCPGDYLLAASLYRTARKTGVTIRSTIDCLIAASCVRTGTLLLHRDADFDRLASCTPLRARRV